MIHSVHFFLKPAFVALFLAGMFGLAGCASSGFLRTGKHAYPPRDNDCAIDVLMADPQQPYEEICIIEAKTSTSWFSSRDLKAMLPDIKKEACKCGADAVVIKQAKQAESSFIGGGSLSGQSVSAGIKFKKPEESR